MIVKYGKYVNGVFLGETYIKKMYKGGLGVIWDNPYNSETYRILKENFPTKIGEIIEYANWHPQIVPFINEDPMLVCSLGIEGMPVRMLVGDGVAYIATNFKLKGKDSIRATTYVPSTVSGNLTIWCSRDWSSTNIKTHTSFLMGATTSSLRYDYGDGTSQQKDTGVNIPRNKPATISTIKGDYYLNGTRLLTQPEITFEAGGGLYLYTSYWNQGQPPSNCLNGQGFSNFIDERDGDISFGLLAMERNGVNGMIDYVSGTFYSNANKKGVFTIKYYLPDGTEWTPIR